VGREVGGFWGLLVCVGVVDRFCVICVVSLMFVVFIFFWCGLLLVL